MFFDPLYFIILAPALLLSAFATLSVRTRFARYRRVALRSGLSGAEAARRLLDRAGLSAVRIETTAGLLGDHYDPTTRTLRLSRDVFSGRSVSAVGVAAHEAGHALQHADRYLPLQLRTAMVPIAALGSNLAWVLILAGMLLSLLNLAKIGVVLFAGVVAFSLVTLPVELDASRRARMLLSRYAIVSGEEASGVGRVLNAAAMTYVAGALTAVLTLLYYLIRLGFIGGRDE
ncbi:MAG: zinc metallopeptidase [Candidatus Schekmanbacteria bacterium]|nr:zinc metallopeptidase [Candidatus Schekmanbacteria bacterium]